MILVVKNGGGREPHIQRSLKHLPAKWQEMPGFYTTNTGANPPPGVLKFVVWP